MNRLKVSKNFYLDEYVTEGFYKKWGAKCVWWIRPEVIAIDQFIRDRFNLPIAVNNWVKGGSRQQSGLRYPEASIGAGDSLHKFGCASDKSFVGVETWFYDEVRKDIKDNYHELYKPLGLTTIEENTATWLHTDVRNTKTTELKIIYP